MEKKHVRLLSLQSEVVSWIKEKNVNFFDFLLKNRIIDKIDYDLLIDPSTKIKYVKSGIYSSNAERFENREIDGIHISFHANNKIIKTEISSKFEVELIFIKNIHDRPNKLKEILND